MAFDRAAAATWYRRNRARSRALFDLLVDEAYYSQPIALRHPIVFYEGHLPGFSFNTLVKKGARPAEHRRAARVAVRARHRSARRRRRRHGATGRVRRPGRSDGPAVPRAGWPSRDEVHAFAEEADRQVLDALLHADVDRPGHPLLDRAEAVFTILEHEAMHQETLLYMWHRLPFEQKRKPAGYRPRVDGRAPRARVDRDSRRLRHARRRARRRSRSAGTTSIRRCSADVPAFAIERHDVTNARYLEFVDAGGYRDRAVVAARGLGLGAARRRRASAVLGAPTASEWYWRGMFDLVPLPLAWPVYVSQAEASAYARWRGARLPTEAEFQRAAYGSPDGERRAPVGRRAEPDATRGVFDFASWDPEPAGSHPNGCERLGRRGSRRQRLGVDEHAVRAVSRLPARWRRIRNTRPTSSTASTS